MFNSYAQICCKRYHIIFSAFPLKFKCKICVQKEVIHNVKKKLTFGHVTSYEPTHVKQMVQENLMSEFSVNWGKVKF